MLTFRVGYGYDIHRLEEGRRLVLGGVEIPFERGLAGHSDADVVCHALADAILGALGQGDIGVHFPPEDERWRNADSLQLLGSVWDLARREGARLGNADITLVAEAPRLADHIPAMRANLAARLAAEPEAISVKATTNERLGAEGRGEGISAAAICLLVMDDG